MSNSISAAGLSQLDAIVGKKMIYQGRVDVIDRYDIKEERERVFFIFHLAGAVNRTFEGLDIFLQDMNKRISDYENNRVSAPPSILGDNIREEAKTIVAYVGDNSPIDRCIASLMEDLDGLNTGKEIDESKLKQKISIADNIVRLETAKVQKGAVVAKMMGGI